MDAGIQSSFIPHDAGKPSVTRVARGGLGDLLLIFSIVLFAASCALAGAVFLYQQYLTQQSTSDVAQLQRAESSFQPALVNQIVTLNDRMTAAQQILAAHTAPSALLDALNQVTLQTVSYTSFTYDASDPTKIQLTLSGLAQSVNSIAWQADLLSKSGVFTDPIFSGIQRGQNGVQFNLTMLANPSAINYESLTGGTTQSTSTMNVASTTTSVPATPASTFDGSTGSTNATGTSATSTTH